METSQSLSSLACRAEYTQYVSDLFRYKASGNKIDTLSLQLFSAPDSTLRFEKDASWRSKFFRLKHPNDNVPFALVVDLPPEERCGYWISAKDLYNYKCALIKFSKLLPDIQLEILAKMQSIPQLLTAVAYSQNEALETYSALALKKLQLSYALPTPAETLLKYMFEELTSDLDRHEISSLLDLYARRENASEKSKLNWEIKTEIASEKLSQIAIGMKLGLKVVALIALQAYATAACQIVAEQISQWAPAAVVELGNTLFEHKLALAGVVIAANCTRLNKYTIVRLLWQGLRYAIDTFLKGFIHMTTSAYSASKARLMQTDDLRKSQVKRRLEAAAELWVRDVRFKKSA